MPLTCACITSFLHIARLGVPCQPRRLPSMKEEGGVFDTGAVAVGGARQSQRHPVLQVIATSPGPSVQGPGAGAGPGPEGGTEGPDGEGEGAAEEGNELDSNARYS